MKEEIVRKAVEDVRNMNLGDEFSVSSLVKKYDNDVDSKTLFEYAKAILDALKEEIERIKAEKENANQEIN